MKSNTMKNNTTAKSNTEVKVNRYTILDAEIKRVSNELKQKKQEMVAAVNSAIESYRKYRKEVYAPARAAAFKVYAESKVVGKNKSATAVKVSAASETATK